MHCCENSESCTSSRIMPQNTERKRIKGDQIFNPLGDTVGNLVACNPYLFLALREVFNREEPILMITSPFFHLQPTKQENRLISILRIRCTHYQITKGAIRPRTPEGAARPYGTTEAGTQSGGAAVAGFPLLCQLTLPPILGISGGLSGRIVW